VGALFDVVFACCSLGPSGGCEATDPVAVAVGRGGGSGFLRGGRVIRGELCSAWVRAGVISEPEGEGSKVLPCIVRLG
jgi:hypothetical protein